MNPAVRRATAVGIAALGGRPAYVGKVKDDELGRAFVQPDRDRHALRNAFQHRRPGDSALSDLCDPDGQRTMNTFLGASTRLARKTSMRM